MCVCVCVRARACLFSCVIVVLCRVVHQVLRILSHGVHRVAVVGDDHSFQGIITQSAVGAHTALPCTAAAVVTHGCVCGCAADAGVPV